MVVNKECLEDFKKLYRLPPYNAPTDFALIEYMVAKYTEEELAECAVEVFKMLKGAE